MGIFNRVKNVVRSRNAKFVEENETHKLFKLMPNDMVNIENVDYEVMGSILFDNHGWQWTEYKLKDGMKTLWLSVERDDEIEIYLAEEIDLDNQDITKKIQHKGITYYQEEHSRAVVKNIRGDINLVVGEQVEYAEYEDDDGDYSLSIEIWDGESEYSLGRPIREASVEVYG